MMKKQNTYISRIVALLLILMMMVGNAWAGVETHNGKQYNVVYLKSGSSGNGDSKDSPVGSWANAYKKLTNTGSRDYDWEHNVIVIVGDMQINYKENDTKDRSSKQGTAATITGVWPWDANDKATTTQIKNGGQAKISGTTNNIGADVRFRNLRVQGDGGAQDRMSLRLHSTLFDEGLVMMGFAKLDTQFGMIDGRNAPALHIQLSFDQPNGNLRPSDVIYKMPGDSAMTVTFKSGRYGRVAVSRTQGTSSSVVPTNYIQGTPENPVLAHIIVDIPKENDNTQGFADDFGILMGGSSQGIVCADLQFDIKRGSIGTLVAGAQGNNIANIVGWKIPQGTFAGRSIINLESDDITIQNLYVGTQGRTQSTGSNGTAYFYGQATLNMRGGTIEKGVFASAAAFSGLGNDTYHTPDYAIPYVNNNNVLTFSSYDRNKTMATIKSGFNGNVDLKETVFTMNIYGGTIRGGLCGGSRGYDSFVKTQYAPDGAGSHYGDTNINVYGGTISGGIYGGGLGDTGYYEAGGKDGFLKVAQVFGNTNVKIYGGNIEGGEKGGIYGGGKGVKVTSKNRYTDIAKVYGNTNVVIDPRMPDDFDTPNPDWTYTGNIYGGGALGSVDGNTNVTILGGIILGDIFGAGEGEDGYSDKAKVTGTTKVIGAVNSDSEQDKAKVKIYGNIYGGGKLSQVVAKDDVALSEQLVTDEKLHSGDGGLFNKDAHHSYTTYVKLSTGTEIFGKIFGGGKGKEGGDEEVAGLVKGQTDVVLEGATTWERIYGGGEMADISGNTLVHFKKGKMAHDAYGGGLGKLTANKENGELLPDNRQTVLASADIKKITGRESTTGHTFVVFDGEDGNHTEYEYKILKTYEVDNEGKITETELNQFDPNRETQLFLTDHNIYGGGMTAANVAGNTYTHINYGMVSEGMLNEPYLTNRQWDIVYNSIANAQFCVFGGGYGYHAQVNGNTNVTMDIEGDHAFRYLKEFNNSFSQLWDGSTDEPVKIAKAADVAKWSHGAPGRSCMDIVGGGYNGKVLGSTNVTIGGDVVVRKVYGGGYYASVNETNVTIKSGLFNRIYGGGLIGNVYGKANITFGQQGTGEDIRTHNGQLLVKDAIYGGNDVSGTVGTSEAINHTNAAGVTYHVYNPVDDAEHEDNKGVRMNIYGGLVLGDVYGAGNGNHTGYTNPEHMQFSLSQHPSENYRKAQKPGQPDPDVTEYVYKYRPRTAHVVMNIQGNEGADFNDGQGIDKVRIWGRTFGGGNSCNVGKWDGTKDDNAEVYAADETSWHPGNNFLGEGTIEINIGSHVQLGNRNDSHEAPNGLFMGSNGQYMVTQSTKPSELEYYHHYFHPGSYTYLPGFLVFDADGNDIGRKAGLKSYADFINNILTWSDNVKLNINDEAEDVWMSNFVGGGYRGSMKAKTENGSFYYRLPKGVTIGHAVVGGSYNSHIVYRIYKSEGNGYAKDGEGNYIFMTEIPDGWVKDDGSNNGQYLKELYEDDTHPDQITAILRYNFDGGMLAHDSELNASTPGSRIHNIHNPSSLTTSDFTCDEGYFANKEKALVRLELQNRLHPAVHEANPTEGTELNVHGGIVYGGCYLTGYVEGDSWVDYDCSLSPLCTDERFFGKRNKTIYDEVADLNRNNALNIFGAGFGVDTHSMGDVYLCVKASGNDISSENGDWPFIYNVFGGSNMGTVGGSTNVYYDGGKQGTMLGSLYGGGYKGDIAGNTYVELVQGFLMNVYGGSRQANIGGAAHVWAYDGSTRSRTGLTQDNYNHLIICNMYGGNDISGTISGTMPATWTKNVWTDLEGVGFNSYIQVSGTEPGQKGFPLVGNIYGGGNGEQWSEDLGVAPNVGTSLLEIDGGTTLNAFGGGNMATITDNAYIFVNASDDHYADVSFTEYQKGILEDKFFKTVRTGYIWNGTELQMSSHHVDNLFGGNNVATMTIQPKWNLKSGKIGNVYSGGNMGDMTYYNALAGTTGHETESKGLSIDVNSDDINIESLYGGCRMSDVKAMVDATTPAPAFSENEYGATVNVIKGHIGNVYGGNDISGYVYNGTNVNLSGSITGNVYGAGNGNYLYAYDRQQEHVTSGIAEVWYNDVNQYVYWIPGDANATPLQQLLALNKVRPHVSKAYLDIQGASDAVGEKVYIYGSVYCGGNASTICPMTDDDEDAHVKFNIGNNVIVNEVFMGSNGESLKYDANGKSNYLVNFEKVNEGLNLATDLSTDDWSVLTSDNVSNADKELVNMDPDLRNSLYPNLLSVYMRAVDMKAMPQGFDIGKDDEGNEKTFNNTWIGTFCLGGNAGSMMVDKPVDIVFPQSLNFFGRIIGGSKDASFMYKGKWHRGGFRMPLAADAKLDGQDTKTKLRMKIRGDWYSRRMVLEDQYKSVGTYAPMGDYLVLDKTNNGVDWDKDGKAWSDGCNVYGGCYQSGDMVGDVQIYIESDMLAYSRYLHDTPGATIDDYIEPSLDESNKLNLPVSNVYGAGYGPESRSFGDAYIYMKDIPNVSGWIHPSVNNIFGGGRNGMLVGNSVIHVHDGLVYKDVVGGSFAAPMYGSAQVTVGYPKFYVCKQSGEYFLDRADKWNEGYMTKGKNGEETVIRKSIRYFEGTYVPCNVYDQITGVKLHGSDNLIDLSSIHTATRLGNAYFDFHDESADASLFPTGGWNSVDIRVRGGVYGGGFSLSNSTAAIAGSYTTLANTSDYNHGVDSQGNSSVGYGGNSSIIISDFVGTLANGQTSKDHIRISTENPVVDNVYSGTGGIYGDGRLVFCEGFRAAELNGYGYAEHTPSNPLMLNSLQRLDLLTVNDCCFKLYGDEDFATDELNSQKYSLARIGELRMNSSIDATGTYATGNLTTTDSRNYIGFYNNIHYLGSIVTNDDFRTAKFHDATGAVDNENTYRSKKLWYIDQYHGNTDEVSINVFKQRNYATARNMVGINSGFCLRVENQYYEGDERRTYYGPIVGVAEVKLLNVQPGEGGGYVYADNIHADIYESGHTASDATFMNESGNFVFEGVHRPGDAEGEKQYIVDDCLPKGFDEWKAGRAVASELPEQHYWYVIGDTYYYNTTLTAFSYNGKKEFNLTNSDQNVIFAGIEDGYEVSLKSVQWQDATYPGGYSGDVRGGRDNELTPLSGEDKYKFLLLVGDDANEQPLWDADMPRSTGTTELVDEQIWTSYNNTNNTPRFNVHLLDNVNNCPQDHEEEYFNNHLSVPERVKLIIQARKQNGTTDGGDPTYETKTYNVTLEIKYIQGPSFTGNVNIMNCALPGERIGFNNKDILIKTTEQLPVTGFGWKLVPLKDNLPEGTYSWDGSKATDIPASYYSTTAEGYLQGSVPALYSQNNWNVYFAFHAGGEEFIVAPSTLETLPLNERMLVVHNYHKMADIASLYDVTLASGGNNYAKALKSGAMIYLADNADIAAFASYINATIPGGSPSDVPANTTAGMHFYLQNDITLPTSITGSFAGTLHGNGYSITLPSAGGSLFGNKLSGNVYNLGVPNGTITTVPDASPSVINSFDANDSSDDLSYGKKAYALSHYYTTENDADNYVHSLYTNNDGMGGDWRYARTEGTNARYLRTAAPNYGNMQTSHNTEHAGDYELIPHDCLFFGQTLNPTAEKKYPEHINEEFSVNTWTEANRVYRTAGYYGSSVNDGFHYNKTAWAMQPTLTAIDFTATNPEGNFYGKTDDRPESLTSFNSDHNGTVSPYSNTTTEKVTQNLLVYNNGGVVFRFKNLSTTNESDVQYHNIQFNGSGTYSTDFLHLVDKQDFNAPIAFTVNTRTWYERKPGDYRNVHSLGYENGSAWEGFCLPFEPTKVTASKNGEISHFYGDDETNHEYWLRGLESIADGKAVFVRPETQPIVGGTPYIVSFPGNDFYEFSMEGDSEYETSIHGRTGNGQIATFEASALTIPVSDDNMQTVTKDGYALLGTFIHANGYGIAEGNGGSKFEAGQDILPFRTYMSVINSQAKSIYIVDGINDLYNDKEPNSPDDELNSDNLRIWTEGHNIIISTPTDVNLRVTSISGMLLDVLHCQAGLNRFPVSYRGICIVGKRKLLIK